MSFWSKIGRLFTVDDTILDEDFYLTPSNDEAQKYSNEELRVPPEEKKQGNKKRIKTIRELQKKPDTRSLDSQQVFSEIALNKKRIERDFYLPKNSDIVVRDFWIPLQPPIEAMIVFTEGLVDSKVINNNILEPLMMLAALPEEKLDKSRFQMVKNTLLPGNQVMQYERWEDVKKNILAGSTAVFVDGVDVAFVVETKGWEHRNVSDSKAEAAIRGPHDAFTENLRTNTGLVRSRLRTEHLITEMTQVGKLAPTDVAIMYVKGIANPKLVSEVKRRINAIKADFLQDSGVLEQYIEDRTALLIPKMTSTERPDRVAASLAEGFVAVFVGQSSFALIMPTMIWSMMQTSEDYYTRSPVASIIRVGRVLALIIALLLPAQYIAIANYHPEMIPTDLMLAIAAAREKVPFPLILEVIMMEFAIELILEAGIRIPNVIGPTIGIVGALILGEAAVQARVVSPLLVIVVAITTLATFTMPNTGFALGIRVLRFGFVLMASFWGFYGITLGVIALLMQWACSKSFGVPILSPVSPFKPPVGDTMVRVEPYKETHRPRPLYTGKERREKTITRIWDPTVHDSREARSDMEEGRDQDD
ncbi:spore germination protein [Brevibacillus sp. B_LB10_24]|uniref:spore germination protein n=1 Tax=Brevibacillus sp. B_LB10_24 TaxID=3380645 RepID=UPI0038BACA61